jgi:hypothetical protein
MRTIIIKGYNATDKTSVLEYFFHIGVILYLSILLHI